MLQVFYYFYYGCTCCSVIAGTRYGESAASVFSVFDRFYCQCIVVKLLLSCRYAFIFSGNLATLRNEPSKMGIDTRQRLLDFHGRYYSAPLMTLCVLGKESLQDMKRWVESQFAPVLDRNVASPALTWWGSVAPYVEMLNREVKIPLLQVVPASEGMNYLTLSWYVWNPAYSFQRMY